MVVLATHYNKYTLDARRVKMNQNLNKKRGVGLFITEFGEQVRLCSKCEVLMNTNLYVRDLIKASLPEGEHERSLQLLANHGPIPNFLEKDREQVLIATILIWAHQADRLNEAYFELEHYLGTLGKDRPLRSDDFTKLAYICGRIGIDLPYSNGTRSIYWPKPLYEAPKRERR